VFLGTRGVRTPSHGAIAYAKGASRTGMLPSGEEAGVSERARALARLRARARVSESERERARGRHQRARRRQTIGRFRVEVQAHIENGVD